MQHKKIRDVVDEILATVRHHDMLRNKISLVELQEARLFISSLLERLKKGLGEKKFIDDLFERMKKKSLLVEGYDLKQGYTQVRSHIYDTVVSFYKYNKCK